VNETKSTRTTILIIGAIIALYSSLAMAQGTVASPSQHNSTSEPPRCAPSHLDRCFLLVVKDQEHIWTSPSRVRGRDLVWILPFAGATAVAVRYDSDAMRHLGSDTPQLDFGKNVSNAGSPYVALGAGVGLYLVGAASHSSRLRDTGGLGTEAVVDALVVTEALKLATNRERPQLDNARGGFWPHGTKDFNTNSSMPSGHTVAAWALAGVLAHRYPEKPWLKPLVYGAAATVSVARVLARDHFPSDVLVGSTFGYLIGSSIGNREEFGDLAALFRPGARALRRVDATLAAHLWAQHEHETQVELSSFPSQEAHE
jgi:membrane-associated phospholipid phosphatase